jgi:site-specific DNA-methyltransferase (adenine-specific)
MKDVWRNVDGTCCEASDPIWTGMAPGKVEKTYGRHSTQKPLWLYERIVELSTQPGDIVLDPFMGSGTTGVAAARLGRYFIGAERDPEHFALALRRLAEVQPKVGGEAA